MKEIKVKMLRDTLGSLDGIHTIRFRDGAEYSLPENLYKAFASTDSCKRVDSVDVARVKHEAKTKTKNILSSIKSLFKKEKDNESNND